MNEKIIDSVMNHAKNCYPYECCGLIIENENKKLEYIECTNIVPDNENERLGAKYNFAIDPREYVEAEERGDIKYIVHSHPDASSRPSKNDIARCNESGLPWLIVSYPSQDYRIVEPCEPDLIGRDFVLGVYDCYGLIMDYYKKTLGIELPDYRVNYHWWENGENLYLDNYSNAGFVEVNHLKKHDVILMQVESVVTNHAGIIIDNNTLLHHLYGRQSCRVPYGGYYRDRTTKILRHKNFL